MKYNAVMSEDYDLNIYANPRTITARIVVNGTTTYTQQNIKTFKIDSTPVNGKWFGISYSQQLSVTFIDPNKSININRGDTVKVSLICGEQPVAYPTYYVDSSNRDEKTGDLTVVGFDLMAKANNLTVTLGANFSGGYADLCNVCASLLNTTYAILGEPSSSIPSFTWTKQTVNIPSDGFSLRDFITALAEVGGRFAYINSKDEIVFRMVTNNAAGEQSQTHNFSNTPVMVDKSVYFELSTDKQCLLTGVTHKNELNNTVSVGTSNGINQVIYDNPFLSLLTDVQIKALLNNILDNVYSHVTPFSLNWRGNMACEIGDTMWVANKEHTTGDGWTYPTSPGITWDCFYLSETLEYNGGVRCTVQWEYQPEETAQVGPTNVSTSNKVTKAIVDKQNGQITLAVQTAEQAGAQVTIQADRIDAIVGDWGPTGTHSKIEQTANKLNTLVQAVGPTGGLVYSEINQTAQGLNTLVETIGPSGTAWGPTGYAHSQIVQTSTSVSSSVATNKVDELMGPTGVYGLEIAQMQSDISQTSSEISTLVQAVGPTGGKVYSQIKQNADNISLVVQGPSGATPASIKVGSIVDAINGSSSSVKIDADKIDITGQVTFLQPGDNISDLTNDAGYIDNADLSGYATKSGLATTNYTTINGGNITTGKIKNSTFSGSGTTYSTTGTQIDLDNARIQTPYFYSNSSGAGFKGNLEGDTTSFKKLRVKLPNLQGDYYGVIDTYTTNLDSYLRLKVDGVSGVSPELTLADFGDMKLSAPDGEINIQAQRIQISADQNDKVYIDGAEITGSLSGSLCGDLVSTRYGTVDPSAAPSTGVGTLYFKYDPNS